MGFPILKLPVVALKVVLDHLNNVELVTVSLLSRRAAWFLKACGKKNVSFFNLPATEIRSLRRFRKFQLFLLESKRQRQLPDWNFHLRCSMGKISAPQLLQLSCNTFNIPIYTDNLRNIKILKGVRRSLKIGKSLVPVVIVPNGIHTFWEDKIDGLTQLLSYFKTELNLPIGHMKLPVRDTKAMERVINHINSTQTVVKSVLVERYPYVPDHCIRFILENVSTTEKFFSHPKLSEKFKLNGGIRAKIINITLGHWFTIQNILRCTESEVINVEGSNYTEEELRLFLSEWKAGNLPKLKEVTLAAKVSARDVTGGFERWVGRVTVSLLSRRAAWFLKAWGKKNVSFFNLEGSEMRGLCKSRILELFLLESRRQGELPEWDFELRCSVGGVFSPDILQISCETFFVPIYFRNLKGIEQVEGIRRNLKIEESFVPVMIVPNGIHAFWEDETNGLIQLLSYFKTNLNLSIEHLNVPGRDAEVTERVVKHISSTQTVVKNVLVERYARLSDDDFGFILKNVSVTETFSSYLSVSRNFKFDGTIRAKRILIWNGHWFTIQNVLTSTESKVIHVNGSNYTRDELRTFLREWKAGRFPNLKKLHVNTKVNVLDVIDGFERREDKCENTEWWTVAIKGNGCTYGTFDSAENRSGDFKMIVHNN